MTNRVFNFAAGPAVLPEPVLAEAQRDLMALPGVGMSVMEISHRGKVFEEIIQGCETDIRKLAGIPSGYQVLFLQGGASLQFSMVPMNFLPAGGKADYIVTGSWGKKAVKEAQKVGAVQIAGTTEAKMRGYGPSRFSFNVAGGRCEACQGDGVIQIEMHFLPDVYVQCDVCKGKRYDRETLEVKYREKSIADVLDMTVDEGAAFFSAVPAVREKLAMLQRVGLGYVHVGQPATTLSGGEAQRVKLSKELSRRSTGKTLYILDEPTTGLHFEDVRKLLDVLHALVETGNTVVVIEHNLEVIKTADWVIDLGPEGGDKGGHLVAAGTPEDIVRVARSYTGQFLAPVLKSRADPKRRIRSAAAE